MLNLLSSWNLYIVDILRISISYSIRNSNSNRGTVIIDKQDPNYDEFRLYDRRFHVILSFLNLNI